MLVKTLSEEMIHVGICRACEKFPSELIYNSYTGNDEDIILCRHCSLQLSRKILEDLCDLDGDRHG